MFSFWNIIKDLFQLWAGAYYLPDPNRKVEKELSNFFKKITLEHFKHFNGLQVPMVEHYRTLQNIQSLTTYQYVFTALDMDRYICYTLYSW